jgi:hypothetical protein
MGVATVGHYASCRGCSPGTHSGVFPCCEPGSNATARVPCSRPGTRFGREGGNGNTLACVPCVPPNPDTKNLWERRRYVRLGLRRSDQFVDRPTSAVIMDAARQSGCCFPVDPPARISRIEPKTFLANERTFLNWLSMSVTLGSVASALVSFGKTTHSQVPSALPSMSGTTWPSHTPDSGIATVSLTAKRLERAYLLNGRRGIKAPHWRRIPCWACRRYLGRVMSACCPFTKEALTRQLRGQAGALQIMSSVLIITAITFCTYASKAPSRQQLMECSTSLVFYRL